MNVTTRKKSIVVILIFIGLVYWGGCDYKNATYYEPEILASHFNGEHFVGSVTCKECHNDIYNSHLQTAHYNTSAIADKENIKGSFTSGENILSHADFDVEMSRKGNAFFQHAKDKNTEQSQSPKKIDIVIGSGVKGQTFLTWEDEHLFQLQASYYPPTDTWINSPGYPDQLIHRPVRDGCLKCHVTFATNFDFSGKGNRYDQDKIVYGVDCEKCHRPAEKHVVFHRENPEVQTSRHMLKLDTLSRQLRLDVCAQCHSGSREAILQGNSFTYLAGQKLDEYSRNFHKGQSTVDLDVHGNQYGLLTQSKCFINSLKMDCSTCHSPHQNQRGDSKLFNQKCISCHDIGSVNCKGDSDKIKIMGNNCITCHMPTIPSKALALQLGSQDNQRIGVKIRTHLIGIYPDKKEQNELEMDPSSIKNIKSFIDKEKTDIK